jgi:hypothetical protein
MKKLFFVFTIIGLVSFGCTKIDTIIPTVKTVDAIEGSFIAQYNDISIAKDYSPPTINWAELCLLRRDGSLVDGSEFIKGSVAWNWWHTGSGRNCVGGPASQLVYPNMLLPDEDLRVFYKVQNWNAEDIYFGLVDFNPETVQFPLSIKAYRLGDYLGINADALFKLPGSGNITITVSYSLAPLNLNVTRAKPWNPASTFGFNDIFYDGAVTDNHVYSLTSAGGMSTVYNGFTGKVMGDVYISVVEAASSSTSANLYIVKVDKSNFGKAGKGTELVLTTTKVGWYDSATIGVNDKDITVETIEVPIN